MLQCLSLLLVSALAVEDKGTKKQKRTLEVLRPSFYNSFPSNGISVWNLGTSGLKSGLVGETGIGYGSAISPAISYDSAGHFLSSGVFGQTPLNAGLLTRGQVVEGIAAVTPAPAFSGASFVTGAPTVVTAATPVVTANPPVAGGIHSVITGAPHLYGGQFVNERVSALPFDGGIVGNGKYYVSLGNGCFFLENGWFLYMFL